MFSNRNRVVLMPKLCKVAFSDGKQFLKTTEMERECVHEHRSVHETNRMNIDVEQQEPLL